MAKDVQDQRRAVEDAYCQRLLEVAELRRRQLVVKDDDLEAQLGLQPSNLFDFA